MTISGERLKGASFRITAENEENIIPIRVHKPSMHYFFAIELQICGRKCCFRGIPAMASF